MICPTCKNEIEEQSVCPVCGSEIEIDLVSKDRIDWKLLYISNSRIEAEMLKANLESAEIPVFLFSKEDTAYVLSINQFSKVELYVPKEFYKEAVEFIREIFKNNENDQD